MCRHVVIGIDFSIAMDGLAGRVENRRGDPARECIRELRRGYSNA